MKSSKYLRLFSLLLLGFAATLSANAVTITSGTFTADNDKYVYSFSPTSTQSYTFSTTSFAAGGFIPVLTLFNATGTVVGFSPNLTDTDAILSSLLTAGSYQLYLTEFPNTAINTLAQGFEFANSPTVTGDFCNVSGGKFIDDITCGQRTSSYNLNLTTSNPVPEPPTWLLVLPPVALLMGVSRRFTA